jgi:hypothetical protein
MDYRPISTLRLARKIERVRNFENDVLVCEFNEEPRLVEVLWALQFFSQPARPKPGHEGQFIDGYPGGLRAFTRDLIDSSTDLIGTTEMRKLGSIRYDRNAARVVYNEIPSVERRALGQPDENWLLEAALNSDSDGIADMADFVEGFIDARPRRHATEQAIRTAVKKATRDAFISLCVSAAREKLATYLRGLCELPHVHFRSCVSTCDDVAGAPWYFAEIATALLRFIDRRKERIYSCIADTEVSRDIFKWLGRARSTRRGVLISGNSRFGKTESVRAFCEGNPGRARLVETPPSNSESDLLRAVAIALGMEIGPKQRGYQLRDEINYLVEQAGLMLVFDEAQGIFPCSFTRNTSPTRLNWIRRNVLDRAVPAAFICTPQSYEGARKKFLRVTNFAIQQWDERLLRTVHLPEQVESQDLLAIARIRFPALHADELQYLVTAVQLTERNYVSDISRVADLARFNAEDAGRQNPNLSDIKAAIADAVPGESPSTVAREPRPIASSRQRTANTIHHSRNAGTIARVEPCLTS